MSWEPELDSIHHFHHLYHKHIQKRGGRIGHHEPKENLLPHEKRDTHQTTAIEIKNMQEAYNSVFTAMSRKVQQTIQNFDDKKLYGDIISSMALSMAQGQPCIVLKPINDEASQFVVASFVYLSSRQQHFIKSAVFDAQYVDEMEASKFFELIKKLVTNFGNFLQIVPSQFKPHNLKWTILMFLLRQNSTQANNLILASESVFKKLLPKLVALERASVGE
jgi:hypothetical protein